jgi:transposase
MAKKELTVHVARIRACKKGRQYETVLLRHSYRQDGRVRHLTVAKLTNLQPDLVNVIERACRGEALVGVGEAFSIQRSLPHGHVAAVLGSLREIGLDKLIAARRSPKRDAVLAMIAQRILDPAPKLATARALHADTAQNSLGECLGLGDVDEDDLYEAMDWLLTQQQKIEQSLAKKHLKDGALVLYDLTSTYFEGRTCPLAKHGYSRDGKPGKLQIEFGLLCNAEGCPVAVEVFEGNVADPMTVRSQVEKLRERFGLRRIVMVGDRGMLTEARIREDLQPGDVDWVTSLRAPAIRSLVEQGALQLSLFDERDLMEITSSEYPGERLVVCRNPTLAEDRRRRREALLSDTEKELAKIAAATRRDRNPLVGKEAIGLRVGKVIEKRKVGKHFLLEIGEDGFSYSRDEAKIAAEAALDGFYVIRTSVPLEELGSEETVAVYKRLSRVERAFRSMKTVDLKVRPIHHRLADRVRAHVLLCTLAYYVEWHMRQRLAPLLFDDERPEEGAAARASVVSPACRSESAETKAQTKRTEDALPAHSFRTLLSDLSTLTRNLCTQAALGEEHPVRMLSEPTPVQRRAFELLGVSPMV